VHSIYRSIPEYVEAIHGAGLHRHGASALHHRLRRCKIRNARQCFPAVQFSISGILFTGASDLLLHEINKKARMQGKNSSTWGLESTQGFHFPRNNGLLSLFCPITAAFMLPIVPPFSAAFFKNSVFWRMKSRAISQRFMTPSQELPQNRYFFSKLFFSPQLGHFCGLHLASFSNPHLLHLKSAIFSPPLSTLSQGKGRKLIRLGFHLKASPGLNPSSLRILAKGQNPVYEAWRRFAPTKAVNHSQYGLCT
jgi:hypothetical protein